MAHQAAKNLSTLLLAMRDSQATPSLDLMFWLNTAPVVSWNCAVFAKVLVARKSNKAVALVVLVNFISVSAAPVMNPKLHLVIASTEWATLVVTVNRSGKQPLKTILYLYLLLSLFDCRFCFNPPGLMHSIPITALIKLLKVNANTCTLFISFHCHGTCESIRRGWLRGWAGLTTRVYWESLKLQVCGAFELVSSVLLPQSTGLEVN